MEEIENQAELDEEGRAQALRQERAMALEETTQIVTAEIQEKINSLIPLVQNKKKLLYIAPLAMSLASSLDAGDIVLAEIFAVPIIGDIIDLSEGGILALLFSPIQGNFKFTLMLVQAIATFIELLPFVITDAIPSFTIATAITIIIVLKKARNAKKQIAELKNIDIDQIAEEELIEEFA